MGGLGWKNPNPSLGTFCYSHRAMSIVVSNSTWFETLVSSPIYLNQSLQKLHIYIKFEGCKHTQILHEDVEYVVYAKIG